VATTLRLEPLPEMRTVALVKRGISGGMVWFKFKGDVIVIIWLCGIFERRRDGVLSSLVKRK